MSSAKIIVLSLKEIIRVALFVVFGIFALVIIAFLFVPNDDDVSTETEYQYEMDNEELGVNTETGSSANYKNGEYISQIPLDKGQSYVQVSVKDDAVTDIKIINQDELATSFYPLLQPICQQINEKLLTENTIGIETDYNNQYTTYVITQAINDALNNAVNN